MSEFPRCIYESHQGWRVVQVAEYQFRLADWHYGFIGVFGTLQAAVAYMEKEFL